jgi:outer membrane protein, heavy metal efflux system
MKQPLTCLSALILAIAATHLATASSPSLENLTLDQAIAMADRLHPDLQATRWLAEAAGGEADQAGSFPNPELVGRVESAPMQGSTLSQADYLAGVSQTVPLSRRLARARQMETLEQDRRILETQASRLRLHQRVQSAFATALYQQRAALTQAELHHGAQQAVALITARLEAGDAIPQELARAEWHAAEAQLEFRRTQTLHDQALDDLATALGDRNLSIASLKGDLEAALQIPTLESIALEWTGHPAILAANADVNTHQARLDLALANRVPDIRVEALYRRMESTQQNAFDVGIHIPLPLFDQNRGRVRAASADLRAAEARSRSARITIEHQRRESHRQLADALATVRTYRDQILPRANTVRRAWEARFEAGDVSLAELLPVQRDWAGVKLDYLDALRDALQAWSHLSHAQ